MAQNYHSLKLFRLLIGDVSQVDFADLTGFDASAISLIEAGHRGGTRVRGAIKAMLHPFASDDDVDVLIRGTMGVADVHRLAQAYAQIKNEKLRGQDARGPVGGSNDGEQVSDAGGAPQVCAPAQPASDRGPREDDAGASEQGGARASA